MKNQLLNDLLFKKVTRPKLDLLIRKYASDKKTLDIGSNAAPYKKYFPNIVTLDIEPFEGVDVVADAHKLPFENGSFDVVLLTSVLGDCEDPYMVISEVERVLNIGGIAILNVPFLYPMNDAPFDFWRFTPFTLRKLFRKSKEVEIVPVLKQLETIALILQRMAYQGNGTKFKRFIFAVMARIIDILNIDRFIDQSGYTNIDRKTGEQVDCFVTAMYFAVFEKQNEKL